jgi:Arc/MetJ family transcription regulator
VEEIPMRGTVDIPDDLLRDAQALSGLKTKREIVTAALDEFVRRRRLERLRARIGRGNLDLTQEELEQMRADEAPVAVDVETSQVDAG